MITRDDALCHAADDCMKELYSFSQPSIEWDEFVKENKIYSEKYREWELYIHSKHERDRNPEDWEFQKRKHPDWEEKSITECIGPRPYEFHYLPAKILKDITANYVRAYKMDSQQELLDTIETLKNYCKEPVVDKYIDDYTDEYGNHHPGYRSYDHPDNLEKEITKILGPEAEDNPYHVHKICDKFFEFLDMAGKFYNWNRDLNAFYQSVYLGASPSSSKERVIENWKKYRKQDIEINEKQIEENYYGDEYDDKELD